MRLTEEIRAIIHDPTSNRWLTPERLRRLLRIGLQFVGLVAIASVTSFAVVTFVPLPLQYKAILFCFIGFAIYALLVVLTGTTELQ